MLNLPQILVLNGPNLNLLGRREPEIYGHTTLAEIEATCRERAQGLGCGVVFEHSNHEGDLIEHIQNAAARKYRGIILNAAALTHTSLALLDAILAVDLPVIEVHLSNPYARESYRHHSYLSPAVRGIICGFGGQGYVLALEAMATAIATEKTDKGDAP